MVNKGKMILIIHLATFFFALHYSLTLYIESSFLASFLSAQSVGLLFTVASLISIVLNFNISPILKRIGNYHLILITVALEVLFLFLLSLSLPKELVVIAFTFHQILLNLIFLSLTVFLEEYSSDETTGGTRGVSLTVINAAILLGPLMAGIISGISGNGDYKILFLISSILILPMFLFISRGFRQFEDPVYESVALPKTLGQVIADKDLRSIFIIKFLLEFFYGIMVIYTPIYLHIKMGIAISDILLIIMPIALIPFIVLPYILGNLADKKLGEKEMLLMGFLMTGLFTFYLSFITSSNVMTWAVALFLTRVGASIIETMAETYFFKHVSGKTTDIIGFFRNLRPFSYILAPVIASAFLAVFDFKYLFAFLSIIFLLGIRYSFILKDTR